MELNGKKIHTILPEPERCDNCGSENITYIVMTPDGCLPTCFWSCRDCLAQVSCHTDTRIPMGRMADRETRQLRQKCHSVFDPLWKSGLISRDLAYKWLASQLRIHSDHCHISWLTKLQLIDAIYLSEIFYKERKQYIEKRVKKQAIKRIKQSNKTRREIDNRKKHYRPEQSRRTETTFVPYPRGYR